MGPYDKQEIRSTAEQHWFSGYTISPSMEIRVLAFNRSTQTWNTVATTVSSASPSLPANVWYDNPDLYNWSVPATFSNPCFYNSSCLPPSDDYGLRTVRGPA
jgi:hypothetical protein